MKSYPVIYCNLIIHSQMEYSTAAHAVIVRCTLECQRLVNAAVSPMWKPY